MLFARSPPQDGRSFRLLFRRVKTEIRYLSLVYLLSVGRMIATYSDKSLLLAVSFEIITSCLDEVFVLIKIQHKASDFGWPTITVGPGTNYWNGTYQLLLMVQINCLGSNDPFGVESKCQPV